MLVVSIFAHADAKDVCIWRDSIMQYVFIHGIGQCSSSWDKTISFMTKPVNAKCPDFSKLLKDEEFTYANLYRAFSNYCNNIPKPLNLCGLSLGGILALNYAIDNPARVHSLVLIGAQYKVPRMLLIIQNIILQFMPKSNFQKIGFNKKNSIRFVKSLTGLNFSDKLSVISCPTLILCGENDFANKKAVKNLADKMPGASFQLIENAAHEVNVDNPQVLALTLESFYSAV